MSSIKPAPFPVSISIQYAWLNPINCELLWNLPTVVSSVPAIEPSFQKLIPTKYVLEMQIPTSSKCGSKDRSHFIIIITIFFSPVVGK